MDSREIGRVVRDFLSQNYSTIQIEKTKLVDQTWTVQVRVSSFGRASTKKVRVNDKTGHIIDWT